MVRSTGLEPAHLAAYAPQACGRWFSHPYKSSDLPITTKSWDGSHRALGNPQKHPDFSPDVPSMFQNFGAPVKQRPEKEPEPQWPECHSLMEWAEQMFRRGYPAIVLNVVKTLPPEHRKKYKDLFERIKSEKEAAR